MLKIKLVLVETPDITKEVEMPAVPHVGTVIFLKGNSGVPYQFQVTNIIWTDQDPMRFSVLIKCVDNVSVSSLKFSGWKNERDGEIFVP